MHRDLLSFAISVCSSTDCSCVSYGVVDTDIQAVGENVIDANEVSLRIQLMPDNKARPETLGAQRFQ